MLHEDVLGFSNGYTEEKAAVTNLQWGLDSLLFCAYVLAQNVQIGNNVGLTEPRNENSIQTSHGIALSTCWLGKSTCFPVYLLNFGRGGRAMLLY